MIANIWSCTPNLPIWTASFKQLRFHNFLQHFRKITHHKWLFPCLILLSCSFLVEALLAWRVCTKDLLLAEGNVYKSWGGTSFWGIFLGALRTLAPAGDSPLYYSQIIRRTISCLMNGADDLPHLSWVGCWTFLPLHYWLLCNSDHNENRFINFYLFDIFGAYHWFQRSYQL